MCKKEPKINVRFPQIKQSSDVYMDDISNMKYKIHHLHLEQKFNQQKHDQKF